MLHSNTSSSNGSIDMIVSISLNWLCLSPDSVTFVFVTLYTFSIFITCVSSPFSEQPIFMSLMLYISFDHFVLQCFYTFGCLVGWATYRVKIIPEMTFHVSPGWTMLTLTHSVLTFFEFSETLYSCSRDVLCDASLKHCKYCSSVFALFIMSVTSYVIVSTVHCFLMSGDGGAHRGVGSNCLYSDCRPGVPEVWLHFPQTKVRMLS